MSDDTYSNYQNKFIALANVRVGDLPKSLRAWGEEFIVKSSFHITLLAVEYIAGIIDQDRIEELKPEIVAEFNAFVKERPLIQYKLSDDLRFVEKDGSKSIIVMAELEGIDELFDKLSARYGVQLPVQPTHVTLYTLPDDTFGIPIFSYDELAEISQPAELPEIPKLL